MTTTTNKIALFGCGSLGANTAMTISRRLGQDVFFHLFDRDRIEDRNLKNQPWIDSNIGQKKATVLASNLWHTSKVSCQLYHQNIQVIGDITRSINHTGHVVDLFIDCFDNVNSRKLVREAASYYNVNCLHAGFSEKSFMAGWPEHFLLPDNNEDPREPVCDRRELAIIVQLGAALTASAATELLMFHRRRKYFFDLVEGKFYSYFTGEI